jgi:Domain of unknown function (DUF397)
MQGLMHVQMPSTEGAQAEMAAVCDGMPGDAPASLKWRISQRSGPNGKCVEVTRLPGGGIALRNPRDPQGSALVLTYAEMVALLAGARDGEFDSLVH